jgi:hypothetical protein
MVSVTVGNFPAGQVLHLVMSAAELSTFDVTTIASLRAVTWSQNGFQYRLVQGFAFLLEIEVSG